MIDKVLIEKKDLEKMKKTIIILSVLFQGLLVFGQNTKNLELTILPGEYWWAGLSTLGH